MEAVLRANWLPDASLFLQRLNSGGKSNLKVAVSADGMKK